MTDWFRMWHGAPTDPKWRTVARRAGVRPGDVWAVVSCLYDRASQAADRGSVAGYDAEVLADALGFESSEVEAIICALSDKEVIVEGRIAAWDKYQPKREDGSAERAKAWRESKKNATEQVDSSANAPERDQTKTTSRLDTETEKKEEPSALPAQKRRSKSSPRTLVEILPEPPAKYVEIAKRHGMPVSAIPPQFQKFQSYHAAKGNRMADWEQAWLTWCMNFNDYSPRVKNGKPSGIFESLDRLEALTSGRSDYSPHSPEPDDGSSAGGGLPSVDYGLFLPAPGNR